MDVNSIGYQVVKIVCKWATGFKIMQFIAQNVDFAERFRLGVKKVSWGWLSCDCVSEDGDASER